MNLLDENVRGDQRELLRKWRIPIRQVGKDFSRTGIQDPDLIPLMHHLKCPTFFTQDKDFFQRKLCHPAYCLVFVHVSNIEVAQYIRRLLRHPKFNTQARRLGKVIHAHAAGMEYWQTGHANLVSVNWLEIIASSFWYFVYEEAVMTRREIFNRFQGCGRIIRQVTQGSFLIRNRWVDGRNPVGVLGNMAAGKFEHGWAWMNTDWNLRDRCPQ